MIGSSTSNESTLTYVRLPLTFKLPPITASPVVVIFVVVNVPVTESNVNAALAPKSPLSLKTT